MESVDQQLRQLKETYEHMTEGELCAIAENAYDLTEIARKALQAVISRRGIAVSLRLESPSRHKAPKVPEDDLVVFTWPESTGAARRTMETLAAAGIPSFLSLEVRADDVKRAEAAMQRALDKSLEEDGYSEDKDYAVLCPQCRSDEVVLRDCEQGPEASPVAAKYDWSCDVCGHQWKDKGIAQELPDGQGFSREEDEDRS